MGELTVTLERTSEISPHLVLGLASVVVALVIVVLWRRASRAHVALGLRAARIEQLAGNPRRARAITRLLERRCAATSRPAVLAERARALLWEGELTRAIELVDTRLLGPDARALGGLPTRIKLEALIFAGRIEEAEALFAASASTLRSEGEDAETVAVEGFLHFHRGDLDGAREMLERALSKLSAADPIASGIHFFLAAVEHRSGDLGRALFHLRRTIEASGDRFLTLWAEKEHLELFPGEPLPRRRPVGRRRRAPRPHARSLVRDLRMGLGLLMLRTKAIQAARFTPGRIAMLVLVNVGVAFGLRCVDLGRNMDLHGAGASTRHKTSDSSRSTFAPSRRTRHPERCTRRWGRSTRGTRIVSSPSHRTPWPLRGRPTSAVSQTCSRHPTMARPCGSG